jgi:hypothetical protein
MFGRSRRQDPDRNTHESGRVGRSPCEEWQHDPESDQSRHRRDRGEALPRCPQHVLVDARTVPGVEVPQNNFNKYDLAERECRKLRLLVTRRWKLIG